MESTHVDYQALVLVLLILSIFSKHTHDIPILSPIIEFMHDPAGGTISKHAFIVSISHPFHLLNLSLSRSLCVCMCVSISIFRFCYCVFRLDYDIFWIGYICVCMFSFWEHKNQTNPSKTQTYVCRRCMFYFFFAFSSLQYYSDHIFILSLSITTMYWSTTRVYYQINIRCVCLWNF